jgi:hypothetical protein
MPKHFDHITVAVRDVDAARAFFGALASNRTRTSSSAARRWNATWACPVSRRGT